MKGHPFRVIAPARIGASIWRTPIPAIARPPATIAATVARRRK
jgi:hypothetical protein